MFDEDGEGPDFSYSTGFTLNHGYPEIILFSLPQEVSHNVLQDFCREMEAGHKPPVGSKVSGIFQHADAVLFPVAKAAYPEHLGWNRWFCDGDSFDCLQLIWPDQGGKFPWEDGFSSKLADSQPDLTEDGWRFHPA